MSSNLKRTTIATVAAVAISGGLPLAPSAAHAAKPLTCHASVSDSTPKDYSTVTVRVKTVAKANVTTAAHYKSTTTTHHAKATSKGVATIKYEISGATPGYKVKVTVTVQKSGRKGACSTAFKPRH